MLWATVGLGMDRTGLGVGDDRPISYLGTDPRFVSLFRGGLLVASVLLVTFAGAAARHLRRPAGFLAVFLVGMAGQAIVAVVPLDSPGAGHTVHTISGIVLGLSLPLLMWRFAAGQQAGRRRRQAYGLMWLEVAGCVAGVTLSRAGRAAVAEMVPAGLFHLWILVVTLWWGSWRPAAGPEPAPGS